MADCPSSAVIVANWVAFLSLTGSFIGLLIFCLKYKGPSGKETYYNGYREQNMLGVFINLFCAVAYFAKLVAAHSCDGGFAPFTTIKYVDYMTTCPLLTLDMLWQLEAPYKASCASLVLVCLTFAVAVDSAPEPVNYIWFGTGLSFFTFSYSMILSIVRGRLDFFASCARDSNAKKSIGYLKVALFSYFGIWIFFPVLWILGDKGAKIVSNDVSYVFHCILDVIAKSCYGYALLYFKVFFDKKLIASGVDEEDFQKFSKEVTTHKDDDGGDDRKRKNRKMMEHSPIRHSGEASGHNSPLPVWNDLWFGFSAHHFQEDNYTLFGRIVASNDQPKPKKSKDDGGFDLANRIGASRSHSRTSAAHRTSFSSRTHSPTGHNKSSGFLNGARRASLEGDDGDLKMRSEYGEGRDLEMGQPLGGAVPPMYESGSDDEAAFVERAKQEYQMRKSRSMRRPDDM